MPLKMAQRTIKTLLRFAINQPLGIDFLRQVTTLKLLLNY